MKVTDYIKYAEGRTLISFEVLPPLKGGKMEDIFMTLDPLMEFKPPFVDVTYHRQDFDYSQRESGYFEKVAIRKRPGTIGICASIMHRYGVDAVPHLICGGFSKDDTENALIDLNFLGINNVLALQGDRRKFESKFTPEPSGNRYASELVTQVNDMNNGKYMDQKIDAGAESDFCIGVAGYPEKHFESPNFELDLEYTKAKVDAGADYIVTQMFFDNSKYFEYVEACRAAGITVPIIPGLKPMTKKYQINSIPRLFYLNMPDDLVKEIMSCGDDRKKIKQVGIEWCSAQSKELKEAGVPVLHYYTMGDSDTIIKVIEGM